MPQMNIIVTRKNEPPAFNATGELVDLSGITWQVGLRESAMASGKPSITVILQIPDGPKAFLETSFALWESGTKIFKAAIERWEKDPI